MQLQPAAVSYSARQPFTLFAAGLRYPIAMTETKRRPDLVSRACLGLAF
jgi:hypothetical protein